MALFMACGMIGTRNLYVVRRSSTCVIGSFTCLICFVFVPTGKMT